MCLAVLALGAHPDWPLIVAANRDEYHSRPTQAMAPWHNTRQLLAGKDLLAGGTWLGVTTSGRFALLTNVRNPARNQPHAPTRGVLVQTFLTDTASVATYLSDLANEAPNYNGFNLVLAEPDGEMWHASNHQTPFCARMSHGVHGISNAFLDTPWPKTQRTTEALRHYLCSNTMVDEHALLEIMLDTTPVADDLLPTTGVNLTRERMLATPFILSDDYGTRCTTLVLRHRLGWQWVQEDSYDPQGKRIGRLRYWCQLGEPWRVTDKAPGNLNTD